MVARSVDMRFEIKLRNEVVGFSDPEGGDAAMGVAFGRFFPTPAYSSIQAECIKHRDHGVVIRISQSLGQRVRQFGAAVGFNSSTSAPKLATQECRFFRMASRIHHITKSSRSM